jgi:hypothetical protein
MTHPAVTVALRAVQKGSQMKPMTHQTITLKRGRHTSPEHGVCVMELASMLAGEPFTDHPRSVCPVIAGFLRAYNDSVDDEMRQDLYELAARVIGSRASSTTECARAERLREWTVQRRSSTRWGRLVPSRLRTLVYPLEPSLLGGLAANCEWMRLRDWHEAVLALIDELLAIGPTGEDIAASPTVGASPGSDTAASLRSR